MIRKTYLKNNSKCRVTFKVDPDGDVESLAVCGDFNNWDPSTHVMKRRKDGQFSATVNLKPGEHRFKYCMNGSLWENDAHADWYVPNAFGTEDSMVRI